MRYPPGPKPTSLLGNMPLAGADPLGVYSRWAAEYGDIFHYRFLWNHIFVLSDPDYIDYVLVRNASNFIKDRTTRNSRWLLGDGLVLSEGEHWMRQRRLIQPAFHRDRIAGYAAIMTSYTRDMLAGWRNGAAIDIHREMMQVTLRVVIRSLFGMETGETQTISRSMNLAMSGNTGIRLLMPPWLRSMPWPGMREFRRAVDDLNRAVAHIIAQRRQSKQGGDDLLAMLMAAHDEDGSGMSDKQIRDEVMTFFLAGHETTALALSWALYLLSRNPDAEQKLHEELDRVLGGRAAELPDLPSLIWTDCVIKEAMRLYPPAWAMGRCALKEFELGGIRHSEGRNHRDEPVGRPPRCAPLPQPGKVRSRPLDGRARAKAAALRLLSVRRGPAAMHRQHLRDDGSGAGAGDDRATVSGAGGGGLYCRSGTRIHAAPSWRNSGAR